MLVALLFVNALSSPLVTEKFSHLFCMCWFYYLAFLRKKPSLFLSWQVKFVIKVYDNILDNTRKWYMQKPNILLSLFVKFWGCPFFCTAVSKDCRVFCEDD